MRILVLGDSCSAGIGAPQAVYPSVLHARLDEAHRIENHAVPGFTSADAARYFRRKVSRRGWDLVIVYLGNSDGAQSRYKGAYQAWRDRDRLVSHSPSSRPVVRIRQKNTGEFDERDERRTVATTPQDFRRNLESIAREAHRRGSRVVLINPIANTRFPAAMMGPHAPYYKIVGLPARLADELTARSASARTLIDAVRRHEEGDSEKAAALYRQLAIGQGHVPAVARNNLAVLLHQQNAAEEAVELLKELAGTEGASGAVAAYNLSRILDGGGHQDEAHSYAMRAVEGDVHLYRMKKAYRRQIEEMAARPNVEVLDLAELLGSADFVDYCHPTAEAHVILAEALASRLTPTDSAKDSNAGYVCVHPSPDAYFDVAPTLADHFALDFDVARPTVRQAAAEVLQHAREQGPGDFLADEPKWPEPASDLQANIVNTFRYAVGHPAITSLDDLGQWLPEYGWEIGRFPEYYLCRILHDYAKAAEEHPSDGRAAAALHRQLSSAVQRERVLPGIPRTAKSRLRIDTSYARRVLRKVRRQLAESTVLFEDSRAHRIATVRTWYLREAFRFGAHSRSSMLYPACVLEQLVEGVCVALTIALHQKAAEIERSALSLLDDLGRLRDVHEKYTARHAGSWDLTECEDYRTELASLRGLFVRQ
ncbi:SGNH/GDSL hydrolase family protein [Streptomyces guryensis]|uniref:GDSL-type esterase/lipase family protein n=1 Tax=Streptomyces guryensis TaxID=2886947 RepID=A0A9Q3VPF5_9ACTN|nr:GDSL-type esterase/lipase family protein [Streptomyces guryensis]MCD9875003.1 GDSL-type esterase/lipase family protein [Streptomyces guryensis]